MAPPGRQNFHTTRWSLIDAARADDPAVVREAVAELCRSYWGPLHAEVCRHGYDADEAADLVQGFVAALLAHDALQRIRPERGRLRAYLRTSLRHFLANERRAHGRLKRGGGAVVLAGDVAVERGAWGRAADDRTPEALFDRAWALTLLERVFARVRVDWAANGREAVFDRLKATLLDEPQSGGYRALGAALGLSEGAVKVTIHRLKRQFRDELREAVAATVTDGGLDDEVRYLLRALEGPETEPCRRRAVTFGRKRVI